MPKWSWPCPFGEQKRGLRAESPALSDSRVFWTLTPSPLFQLHCCGVFLLFLFFFNVRSTHTHPQHVPRLQIVVWNVPQLLPLNSICLSIVWEWYKQLPFSVAHKQDPFSFIFFLLNLLCDVLLKSCKLLWKMNLHHIFAPDKKGKWSATLFSLTLQHRRVLTAITSIASSWARKRERKREWKEGWMKKKGAVTLREFLRWSQASDCNSPLASQDACPGFYLHTIFRAWRSFFIVFNQCRMSTK